jgi:glycosyltransferase involved in cell wall biosynthesis
MARSALKLIMEETSEFNRRCLSVIMPVYNEAATVSVIIGRVLAQDRVEELIIVDDCSSDSTLEVLRKIAAGEARIRLFNHEVNRGKGAALKTGFKEARADIVIIQDADLEYDPSEYEKLLRPILGGQADVVYGSRFLGSEAHRVLYYWQSVGNYVLTQLSNMATNLNLTDMETGFKAFRREVIQKLKLEENRFGFEPEVTAKLAKYTPKLRIYEVAVSYYGRTYEEGKKIGWKDGVTALIAIIKYNLLNSGND